MQTDEKLSENLLSEEESEFEQVMDENDAILDQQRKEQEELNEIELKIQGLEEEVERGKDNYIRLAAEFDNFRKRSQREKEKLYADSIQDVVTTWLPLVDNLERALKAANESAESGHTDKSVVEGIEMVLRQADTILSQLDVTPIDDLGTTFDPNLHNAVFQVEDETKGEQEIIEVFQKGYMYKDRVIRHSVVKVAN